MILQILGGSKLQLNAIKKAQNKGLEVLCTDYLKDSPGKKKANYREVASTFDFEESLKEAKKHSISGIMTTGTDQPIYTVSLIAKELNLPAFIDEQTAYMVTNKKAMKKRFAQYNIPTVNYCLFNKDMSIKKLNIKNGPIVIKPLDSQGQRGIYKLRDLEEIDQYIEKTLSYSRQKEVLLEEYYESDEITISGWVKNGVLKILTVTDRITFERKEHIGICQAHEYPSKYALIMKDEIEKVSNKILKAFNIQNGPIYFQMLIGKDGLKVNEIACRIGGAFEDIFIPYITGVDVLDMVVDFSVSRKVDYDRLDNYNYLDNKDKIISELFFIKEGFISYITNKEEILKIDGLIDYDVNYRVGDESKSIINATNRAGHAVLRKEKIKEFYKKLKILDEEGNNLLIRRANY